MYAVQVSICNLTAISITGASHVSKAGDSGEMFGPFIAWAAHALIAPHPVCPTTTTMVNCPPVREGATITAIISASTYYVEQSSQ